MRTLNILSSEMDTAEIRFNKKAFIKERGAEIIRKNLPSPILCELFKILSHLVQLVVIRKRIPNTGTENAVSWVSILSSPALSIFFRQVIKYPSYL